MGKGETNELYDAIPRRHSHAVRYHPGEGVSAVVFGGLSGSGASAGKVEQFFLFTAAAERQKIAEISSAANDEIYAIPE